MQNLILIPQTQCGHGELPAYPPRRQSRSSTMFDLLWQACPDCGASVPRDDLDGHVCDEEQRIRYELFKIRLEVDCFDRELKGWLATPEGRFAVFYAERERRLVA